MPLGKDIELGNLLFDRRNAKRTSAAPSSRFSGGYVSVAYGGTGKDPCKTREECISDDEIAAKKQEGVAELKRYISNADVSMGEKEQGAAAVLNLRTGELRYLYGSDAGKPSADGTKFHYDFSTQREEMVVGFAHSHPKESGRDASHRAATDRLNEGKGPGDDDLIGYNSDKDPTGVGSVLIIKTPSGQVREFP